MDNLPNLTSLNGLQGLTNLKELRVGGIPKVYDWSALDSLNLEKIVEYGEMVFLPDNVKDITGRTEGWDEWWNDDVNFTLSDLAELDTLPDDLLRNITELRIAGGQIYDGNRFDLWDNWERNRPVLYLHDRQTDEQTKVEMPKEPMDLSFLSRLTGLKKLTLAAQPITDLEALRGMTGLTTLEVPLCTKLTDISAVEGMNDLEILNLYCCPVKSLEPLRGKNRLIDLKLDETNATDLSPLNDCDFSYAAECGGLNLSVNNDKIKDFSFMAKVPRFSWMGMGGVNPKKWIDLVDGSQIRGTYPGNLNQQQLDEFVRKHPEILELHIQGCRAVSDLTAVLEMPDLQYLRLSNQMKKAVKSLEGKEYSFRLEID